MASTLVEVPVLPSRTATRSRSFSHQLLLVSGDEANSPLRRLLVNGPWKIRGAEGVAQALKTFAVAPIAVVITEVRLTDGTWRDLLGCASSAQRSPRIIVTSRLADEHLWAEVLNLGGYDVLPQPFVSAEVLHTVEGAFRDWSSGGSAHGAGY
jgi:DNA-binding NtrC family response regulator